MGGSEALVHSRVIGGVWRLKAVCVVGQICVWLLGPVAGVCPWRWCEVCLCGVGGVVYRPGLSRAGWVGFLVPVSGALRGFLGLDTGFPAQPALCGGLAEEGGKGG